MFKDVSDLISVVMIANSNNDIKIQSMISTFENCANLNDFTIKDFNLDELKSTKKLFYNSPVIQVNMPFSNLKNLEDISYMFASTNLYHLDLTNFDTSHAKNMSYLFYESHSLNNIDVSKFDTSNVEDMSHMFDSCEALLSLNLNSFNTQKVKDMSYMFNNCLSLTSIDI
jgi:surface protein